MPRYRFAVLGDPVEHSRSPELHHAMLDLAGLEGEYLKIRADEALLTSTVEELRAGRWDGLNVTMPLKTAAAGVSDTMSTLASRAGSVNTLASSGSDIVGHSTDSSTFRHLVTSERFDKITAIHLLGAGGSAAAALAALDDVAPVYVASRRVSPAEALSARLGGEVIAWGAAVAGALVVNTTPLGMKGETLPEGVLEVASGLIDLPYGEAATPAVTVAEERRIPFVDGHEFLLRQAMECFSLWTGVEVGFDDLAHRVRNV
jgi:shikimate dehydrogenase